MSERTARSLAWALWAVSILLGIATVPLVIANRDAPIQSYYGTAWVEVVFVLVFLSLPTVGALVVSRLPWNAVGWLLLVGGMSFGGSVLGNEYAVYNMFTAPGTLPGASFVLWASSTWVWTPGLGAVAALFLLFPTGRPLSPRWRIVVGGLALDVAILTVAYALRPGPFDPPWAFVANPYAPGGTPGEVMTVLTWIGNGVGALAILLGAACLILRFRRARGIERQQLKWLAYSASLLALYLPFALIGVFQPDGSLFVAISVVGIVVFLTVPIATGLAVLRYRLYDIDVVIERTLVYGATTAAIAAAFFGGIVVLQSALRPITGGSELAVAASTLVCFALFQPLRRSVQSTVDRRFYRSRYDASITLDRFISRLAGEVDLDAIGAELGDAVSATMRPSHVSLWLKEADKG
jgi:hypothetical protein